MEPTVTIRNRKTGETRQVAQSQLPQFGISAPTPPATQKGGSLLPLLGSIAGSVLGAPLGPLGIIGGGALGGGAGAALGGDNVVKEAATGGFGGALGLGVGRLAGPLLGRLGGLSAKAGAGIQKGIVNPKVVPSPFAAEKEAEIASTVGKYARGSAQAVRQKSPDVVRDLGKQIDKALNTNNPGIDPKFAKSTVQSYLDNVAAYDLTDPTFKQAVSVQLKKITSLKTAKDVYKYKQDLSQILGRAFDKVEKGTALTQREEALMATWRSLDDIITSSAPHIKDLTLAQSAFYQAAPGLAASAKKGINIPFTNIPIPGAARVTQGTADLGARALEGKLPRPIGGLLPQTAGQTGARALGVEEAQAAEPLEGEATSPDTQPQTTNITDILKMVALADLAKGGKNISEIIALSNFLNPPLGAATKTQLQQLQGAQGLLDQLESAYGRASQGGEIGPYGKGTVSTLAGKVTGGGVGGKAYLYNNLREGFTALIARSTGERGVLTDADAARAKSLIPSANTTPEFAAKQFEEIRRIFQQAEQRIKGTGEFSIPFPMGGL